MNGHCSEVPAHRFNSSLYHLNHLKHVSQTPLATTIIAIAERIKRLDVMRG